MAPDMSNSGHYETDAQANSMAVSSGDRQQILLDDLRVEIARLAEAVERQNELLAEQRSEAEQ